VPHDPARLVDLDRYPIDDPAHPGYGPLVARCRADLATGGMTNLEGFLRPDALAAATAEIDHAFATLAFFTHARTHNIWFQPTMADRLPAGHGALAELRTCNHTICADQIPDAAIVALYRWPPLVDFIARVLDKPVLHPMEDPLAGLNAMAYRDGDGLDWHFDRAEFSVTLLLQAPSGGGDFEYRLGLRSHDDPNPEGVAALLRGEDPLLQVHTPVPGTLNLFHGRHTAHRVTTVSGPQPRYMAVLTYYERPGAWFTPEEQLGFYGRVVQP
jgi:hypothetical protein